MTAFLPHEYLVGLLRDGDVIVLRSGERLVVRGRPGEIDGGLVRLVLANEQRVEVRDLLPTSRIRTAFGAGVVDYVSTSR